MNYDLTKYFNDILFDAELHKYTINDEELTPVSNVVSLFYPKFKSYKVSMEVGKKRGVSPAILRAQWDKIRIESANDGSEIHSFAEEYDEKQVNINKLKLNNREQNVIKWYKKNKYVVAAKEYLMYSKKYMIGGTADLILFNDKTNKFIIGDWKTNKDLFKNYNFQFMYPPFEFMLNTPFNHYVVQLNLYKILFESGTKYEVEEMKIIWLPKDGEYKEYVVPDITKTLKKYLDENRRSYRTYSITLL